MEKLDTKPLIDYYDVILKQTDRMLHFTLHNKLNDLFVVDMGIHEIEHQLYLTRTTWKE